jgi:hypothetical protein
MTRVHSDEGRVFLSECLVLTMCLARKRAFKNPVSRPRMRKLMQMPSGLLEPRA